MFADSTFARKHKKTWDYPLNFYKKFEITGSNKSYQFQFDLKKDNDTQASEDVCALQAEGDGV